MFALFAGNCSDPEGFPGGVDDLHAVVDSVEAAQRRLVQLVASDAGLDWAHVVDLDSPVLVKVAVWQEGSWLSLPKPELPGNLARTGTNARH